MGGGWVSLYSGGKDSSLALYRALERGLPVERLVTVHPPADSYLYHVPATTVAELAAESIGLPLTEVVIDEAPTGETSTERGEAELEPLERALSEIDNLEGVIAGAIESEYQTGLLEGLCERLGCNLFVPLWQAAPEELARAMLEAGFDVIVVAVAAEGLDGTWLGRRLDEVAVAELLELADRHGVHPLGEGGEFETLVLDGPHMTAPIDLEWTRRWDGTRGHLEITRARLG